MIDNVKAIDNAILTLKNNGLILQVVEGLEDYLFFKIKFSDNKKRACLEQLHLIINLDDEFGKCKQDVES